MNSSFSAHPVITVGVDGSPASDAALVYALDEAVARGARVLAVTAWWVGPVLPEDHRTAADARRSIAAAVQAAAIVRARAELDDPPDVLTRVAHGEPSDVLVDAARHTSCLVVGTEHRSILRRVVEGSVTARCVRNCPVPVVVVPWVTHPETALTVPAGLDQTDLDQTDLDHSLLVNSQVS